MTTPPETVRLRRTRRRASGAPRRGLAGLALNASAAAALLAGCGTLPLPSPSRLVLNNPAMDEIAQLIHTQLVDFRRELLLLLGILGFLPTGAAVAQKLTQPKDLHP